MLVLWKILPVHYSKDGKFGTKSRFAIAEIAAKFALNDLLLSQLPWSLTVDWQLIAGDISDTDDYDDYDDITDNRRRRHKTTSSEAAQDRSLFLHIRHNEGRGGFIGIRRRHFDVEKVIPP